MRRTILLVDDEPVVRALLRVALEPTGSRFVEAADGCEALEVAWREHPDAVLLDVGLPRLSGIDVCRALKTHPEPPRVMLITGNQYADETHECGADDVVAKPFDPAALRERVDALLAASATSAG